MTQNLPTHKDKVPPTQKERAEYFLIKFKTMKCLHQFDIKTRHLKVTYSLFCRIKNQVSFGSIQRWGDSVVQKQN